MPAFSDLLRRVADYFRSHGAEIAQQNQQLKLAFAVSSRNPQPVSPWTHRRCARLA